MSSPTSPTLRERLETDLRLAMKARDRVQVTTLRALISALDNAGAVEVERQGFDYEPKVGLDHDVERRELSEENHKEIIVAELLELTAARDEYIRLGQIERSEEFAVRASIAARYAE